MDQLNVVVDLAVPMVPFGWLVFAFELIVVELLDPMMMAVVLSYHTYHLVMFSYNVCTESMDNMIEDMDNTVLLNVDHNHNMPVGMANNAFDAFDVHTIRELAVLGPIEVVGDLLLINVMNVMNVSSQCLFDKMIANFSKIMKCQTEKRNFFTYLTKRKNTYFQPLMCSVVVIVVDAVQRVNSIHLFHLLNDQLMDNVNILNNASEEKNM